VSARRTVNFKVSCLNDKLALWPRDSSYTITTLTSQNPLYLADGGFEVNIPFINLIINAYLRRSPQSFRWSLTAWTNKRSLTCTLYLDQLGCIGSPGLRLKKKTARQGILVPPNTPINPSVPRASVCSRCGGTVCGQQIFDDSVRKSSCLVLTPDNRQTVSAVHQEKGAESRSGRLEGVLSEELPATFRMLVPAAMGTRASLANTAPSTLARLDPS
jgi:hypothetical protein